MYTFLSRKEGSLQEELEAAQRRASEERQAARDYYDYH